MSSSDRPHSDAALVEAASALVPADDARPAWVWSADGGALLWANTAGLGALDVEGDALESVAPTAPATRSLQAVARTQASSEGRGRIEILRINAGGHQETLVATCRAVMLGDVPAVLAMGSASTSRRVSSIQTPIGEEPSAPGTHDVVQAAASAEAALAASAVAASAVSTGFAFKPRTRPHRFSFMINQEGRIASLSGGLADAVGEGEAIGDGDVATEAMLARVGDLPAAVFHGMDERSRFSEHEVMWPVSDTPLAVPVRLTGFDEDDGSLRVFGTALTAKAVARQDYGQDNTQDLAEEAPGEALPDEELAVEALDVPALSQTEATAAGLFADAHVSVEETASGATESQVPGGAALAAAASAMTAGFAAGLTRPVSPTPPEPVEALDDTLESAEAETAGLWSSQPLPTETVDSTEHADSVEPLDDALELSEARTAGLWADTPMPVMDVTDAPADVFVADAPDDATDKPADEVPEATVKAMQAIAAGLTAGLAGAAASRALGSTDQPLRSTPDASPSPTATPEDDDHLSRPEHLTFKEIARRLGARITGREDETTDQSAGDVVNLTAPQNEASSDQDVTAPLTVVPASSTPAQSSSEDSGGRILPFTRTEQNAERMVLDRLPLAVMVYNEDAILYANRAALDLVGADSMRALDALSGPEALFEGNMNAQTSADDGHSAMTLVRPDGARVPVTGRLQGVRWDNQGAVLLSLREHTETDTAAREDAQDASLLAAGAAMGAAAGAVAGSNANDGALPLVRARIGELEAIVDLASDGVVTLDGEGEIKDLNQAAQALVGYSAEDLIGRPFRLLFPEDSRQTALDYLDDIAGQGRLSLFNEGRELECITAQGGLVPVFMTLGRLTDDEPAIYCAVLRDLSPFKQAETDLVAARKAAEEANAHKSDFLARVSHEIRTPLNAVIGFSEVMLEERFGPVGSERYRQYLRDIHTSGEHLMSLLNDLLDLSKIEAGRMELTFGEVDLNDVVQQCLAIMQPQASQARIIVRTSLPLTLPKVVADIRSVRQVVLNLMSNSIKFTQSGGQIIVSTLYEPSGEVSLRVRDTGRGMNSEDVALAMEPFRQVPTTLNQVITGTGLGLPLTKALVEANRAQFGLESTPGEGTLAMMTFPSQRVLAE